MVAALLALASSLSWGLADFMGGLQSRRNALLAVLLLSQSVALAALLVAVAAGVPIEHDATATAIAAGSGALGIVALTAFYRALAIGTMSIVAPVSATGAAVPVLVGLVSGERPRAVQVAGMALALIGVMLAARETGAADAQTRRNNRSAVLLALVAAVGFGSFFAGMDRAEERADVAWVLLAARAPEVLLILAACVVRWPALPRAPIDLVAVASIGLLDLLANLLFVLATGRGLLSVVGVLGALYPAVTVLLARAVLHERLNRAQNAGVLVTLAGVVALAAGAKTAVLRVDLARHALAADRDRGRRRGARHTSLESGGTAKSSTDAIAHESSAAHEANRQATRPLAHTGGQRGAARGLVLARRGSARRRRGHRRPPTACELVNRPRPPADTSRRRAATSGR